ncbi:MAG: FAD-dependent oxidoreductase, partial [Cyanobacteria bacterium P01_A01_bin.105]
GDCVTGVAFDGFTVAAQVILDGTELGDLLALGEVPHRWGWEPRHQWGEPSAPASLTDPNDPLSEVVQCYPVQSPTYVAVLQDFGKETAPVVAPASGAAQPAFEGTWAGYGVETFLNYGRLPGHRFILNWPQQGNDYCTDLARLVASDSARQAFEQEAKDHSQQFVHHLQGQLGRRYGLALGTFPQAPGSVGGGAFALYPYYRESRRLVGVATVTEADLLPMGDKAPLPVDATGQVSAIAVGNYANDHHYPGFEMPLAPKSIRWGGRWTGTPFAIPYGALIPQSTDGLLACDKNIAVSHIANGATRLQPVVLNIGQAAGMAAALCVQHHCQPRQLPVRQLQLALLNDQAAPAAVVPHYDLTPCRPDWLSWQLDCLAQPERYGEVLPALECPARSVTNRNPHQQLLQGTLQHQGDQDYALNISMANLSLASPSSLSLVTLKPSVNRQLLEIADGTHLKCRGTVNASGGWVLVDSIGS